MDLKYLAVALIVFVLLAFVAAQIPFWSVEASAGKYIVKYQGTAVFELRQEGGTIVLKVGKIDADNVQADSVSATSISADRVSPDALCMRTNEGARVCARTWEQMLDTMFAEVEIK